MARFFIPSEPYFAQLKFFLSFNLGFIKIWALYLE